MVFSTCSEEKLCGIEKGNIKEELDVVVCAYGERMRRHPEERAAMPREKGREFSQRVAWTGLGLAQSKRRGRTNKPTSEKETSWLIVMIERESGSA
jgi:hypothetical protein